MIDREQWCDDDLKTMAKSILRDDEDKLTDWEIKFLDKIAEQYMSLTERQIEKFHEILTKVES